VKLLFCSGSLIKREMRTKLDVLRPEITLEQAIHAAQQADLLIHTLDLDSQEALRRTRKERAHAFAMEAEIKRIFDYCYRVIDTQTPDKTIPGMDAIPIENAQGRRELRNAYIKKLVEQKKPRMAVW
jgi:hypothetical protein